MRLLAISDLHANWPALEAVLSAETFDRLLVGGDLVSYGPHPREVVDFVRRHATVAVRGNHDHALAHGVDCRCGPSTRLLAEATRVVHRTLVSEEDREYLGSLPLTASIQEAGRTFFSVHASPGEPLYDYSLTPDVSEEHLRTALQVVGAGSLLVGHTHLPMLRQTGSGVVINPGSVGQPRDGDPRASYALIEDGVPRLKRVAYDVERTVADLRRLPLAPVVAEALVAILRTGRTS